MAPELLRVGIVSASSTGRDRIIALLDEAGDVDCIGASEAMTELARFTPMPDVIIVDAPEADSLQILLQSGTPALPLVILSEEPDRDFAEQAVISGSIALLERPPSVAHLRAALSSAVSGLAAFSPRHAQRLLNLPVHLDRPLSAEWIQPLTPRELQILRMLADGLPNKSIATELQISDHTAKFHVSQILAKLGAESRTEAVTIGIRRGLVMV
jgi:NarL family two-component system response regulator YdfI